MAGINCELIDEYAKQMVWDKRHNIFDDQIYIFAKQHHKQFKMKGQVDAIITDSPLLLSSVYNDNRFPALDILVSEVYQSFDNINVFVNRTKAYNPIGRNQDEKGAKELDVFIHNFLKKHNQPLHITIDGNLAGANELSDYCINKIKG
jgi:hypothetical protein